MIPWKMNTTAAPTPQTPPRTRRTPAACSTLHNVPSKDFCQVPHFAAPCVRAGAHLLRYGFVVVNPDRDPSALVKQIQADAPFFPEYRTYSKYRNKQDKKKKKNQTRSRRVASMVMADVDACVRMRVGDAAFIVAQYLADEAFIDALCVGGDVDAARKLMARPQMRRRACGFRAEYAITAPSLFTHPSFGQLFLDALHVAETLLGPILSGESAQCEVDATMAKLRWKAPSTPFLSHVGLERRRHMWISATPEPICFFGSSSKCRFRPRAHVQTWKARGHRFVWETPPPPGCSSRNDTLFVVWNTDSRRTHSVRVSHAGSKAHREFLVPPLSMVILDESLFISLWNGGASSLFMCLVHCGKDPLFGDPMERARTIQGRCRMHPHTSMLGIPWNKCKEKLLLAERKRRGKCWGNTLFHRLFESPKCAFVPLENASPVNMDPHVLQRMSGAWKLTTQATSHSHRAQATTALSHRTRKRKGPTSYHQKKKTKKKKRNSDSHTLLASHAPSGACVQQASELLINSWEAGTAALPVWSPSALSNVKLEDLPPLPPPPLMDPIWAPPPLEPFDESEWDRGLCLQLSETLGDDGALDECGGRLLSQPEVG